MPEEQKDVTGQPVTDPAVNQVGSDESVGQVATGTGDGVVADGQQGTTQDAAGSQDKNVPYERFQQVNEAKKVAEQKVKDVQAQLELVNANQGGQQPNQQQQDLYGICVNQLGFQDKEYLNAEENGKVLNLMLQYQSQTNTAQSFVSTHPDFPEIVGKYNAAGTFIPSALLTSYLAKNQHMQTALKNIPQAGMVLYELVKATQPPKVDTTTQQATEAAQILANKQQSISAVPGSGNLDKVEAMRAMSPAEFEIYKQNVMDRAT